MKLFIFVFFISFYTYADSQAQVLEKTTEAFQKTKYGKNIKKGLEKEIKKLPQELLFVGGLGINQKINYEVVPNHQIIVDYRRNEIVYEFKLDF